MKRVQAWVQQHFGRPTLLVAATEEVEEAVAKNGLTLVDVLRPLGHITRLDGEWLNSTQTAWTRKTAQIDISGHNPRPLQCLCVLGMPQCVCTTCICGSTPSPPCTSPTSRCEAWVCHSLFITLKFQQHAHLKQAVFGKCAGS
jgi:hypothetical protein